MNQEENAEMSEIEKYQCPHCDKTCKTSQALASHIRNRHKPQDTKKNEGLKVTLSPGGQEVGLKKDPEIFHLTQNEVNEVYFKAYFEGFDNAWAQAITVVKKTVEEKNARGY